MGALRSDVDDAAATTAASLNQAGVAQKAAVEKLGLSLGSTLSRMVERRLEELRHLQVKDQTSFVHVHISATVVQVAQE